MNHEKKKMQTHYTPEELSEFHHHMPVQLRFNDIDILGHLNNTVYLSLYDLGKARFFEAVRGGRIDWQRVETVIANIDCSFISPIRFGENIEVYTRCVAIGNKSFTLEQVLIDPACDEIKSRCISVMVCIDPKTQSPVEVADDWRLALRAFQTPGTIDESPGQR